MLLSLDFDGVLAQGLHLKQKYAKKWFNLQLEPQDTKKIAFEKKARAAGLDISYRQLMDPLNELHIMKYQVDEACLPTLQKLKKEGYELVVTTSRNAHDLPYAKQFLKHHFGSLITEVYGGRPKEDVMQDIQPLLHLDDDLHKLEPLKAHTIPVYFRQPENAHTPTKEIEEVRTWKEFYDVVHILS